MKLLNSTIGLKALMAVTGIILIGFVIIHMLGNLQIFLPNTSDGAIPIDEYGKLLKSNAGVLWGARLTLLASIGAHIYSAVALTQRSRAARPQNYESRKWMGSTYAVRTMRWGGVILILFVVYHLLHFTVGLENAAFSAHEYGKVKANVVSGFQKPLISIFYIVAQCALGLHLTHGVWSLFRTLGVSSPAWSDRAKQLAVLIGVVITVGNISIPVSILLGLVK